MSADSLTFMDVTGQEITLPGPAKRIVTLPQPGAATVIAVDGVSEHLVGMNPSSRKAFETGLLKKMFPNAASIESGIVAEGGNGWMPNIEAIAALKPDIVIQWGRRGDELVAPLRNAGIPVALMVGGGNGGTEELARENIRLVANILGKQDTAEGLFKWRDQVIAQIRTTLDARPNVAKPKILHLRSSKGKFTATGEKSYQNFYITLVGGENAAAGLGVQAEVNAEQIASWNPDIIMLTAHEADAGRETILSHEVLSQTNAAKTGRVYKTPNGGYVWDSASHESPFTWMWLANLAHPDIFHFDLRREMKAGFERLYNYTPTEEDIDAVLKFDLNAGAANYEQFVRK
ncbi:ABC transporter substrate-binding protein [Brucella sp. C7-11G]